MTITNQSILAIYIFINYFKFGILVNTTTPYGNSFVKITSPVKNQQIPVDLPINISGVSKDNKFSDCKVMLVINKEVPYREVTPVDNLKRDFSKWSFMLTFNNCTTLTLRENKITSKVECNEFTSI